MKKIIMVLIILAGLTACQNHQTKSPKTTIQKSGKPDKVKIVSDTKENSEAPFLFKNDSQIILNWTERDAHDKSKNILKFKFFDIDKEQFDDIKTVVPSKGLQVHPESMAKIGITNNGIMYAVYRKKSKKDRSRFGGKLYYSISNDKGQTWFDEKLVVDDPKATSLSFYDIAVLPNGELGMSWLDNRRKLDPKHKGKCLFFGQTKDAAGFVIQKPIAGSTCECCRTETFVDSKGTIHVAYRNIIEPDEKGFDGYGFTEIRDMFYLKSDDNGQTFTQPQRLSEDNWHVNGCPHTGPTLAYNGQKLAAVWFTGAHQKSGIYYTDKKPGDEIFVNKKRITVEGRHPQMISLGQDYYVVYEEYYENEGKGYYKIVLNTITPDGSSKTKEISLPLTNNNHPVLTPFKNKILVAWVNTDTRHPKIVYKIIDLK